MWIWKRKEVYLTLIGIPIPFVEEIHTEMGEGNDDLMTLILHLIIVVPTIEDMTTLRLTTNRN